MEELGFFCEVDGSDEIRLDNEELKEGRWFSAEEIDFRDDDFSLTREICRMQIRNNILLR